MYIFLKTGGCTLEVNINVTN